MSNSQGGFNLTTMKKIWIIVALFWTYLATIGRSIRLPSDFAKAHWLLDYQFGFVKRGFMGSIVSQILKMAHLQHTEQQIHVLSFLFFALFSMMIMVAVFRILNHTKWSMHAFFIILVFLSSPFIVMSANLMGFYDHIVIMILAVSIAFLLRGKIWTASILQAVSIFIHESSILVTFPVFCFAWLLINSRRRQSDQKPLSVTPLCFPIAAFLFMVVFTHFFISKDFTDQFIRYLTSFKFIQNDQSTLMPNWISMSFFEWFLSQKGAFIGRIASVCMYGLVLPTVFVILSYIVKSYKIKEISIEIVLIVFVCFIQQILHAVAWDTARIWTYPILSSFVILWVYSECFEMRLDMHFHKIILCLIVILMNVISMTPLQDGIIENFSFKIRLLLFAPVLVSLMIMLIPIIQQTSGKKWTVQGIPWLNLIHQGK
jgi:hypothetical protein